MSVKTPLSVSEMQRKAAENHARRGYTMDLPTLGLGVCEEAGEVAKAINLRNPLYHARPGKVHDSLEHEIADLLVYILAVCNSADIDLTAVMEDKLIYREPVPKS